MRRNFFQRVLSFMLTAYWLALPATSHLAQSIVGVDAYEPSDAGDYTEVFTLPNGNLVLTAFIEDVGGDYYAQYLYNSKTGELINPLTGSPRNGSDYTIIALPNGNFVISYPYYDIDVGSVEAGVIYLFNGNTGELISKLVGDHAKDRIGLHCYRMYDPWGGYIVCDRAIKVLPSGNFLVLSPHWDNGMGAVTWCSATSGCAGVVSSATSLVGTTVGDQVGCQYGDAGENLCTISDVTTLPSGNFLVFSPHWGSRGAVTRCSETSGCTGSVSNLNSLVGSPDYLQLVSLNVLSNGNYVIGSLRGVTWCAGASGCTGSIEDATTMVTNLQGEQAPKAVTLSNGNYIVLSPAWNNGRGAVTWCNGASGCAGVVSSATSLVGTSAGDRVGCIYESGGSCLTPYGDGVISLPSGNYLVSSPYWDRSTMANAGAVTWCNGTGGCTGSISTQNSLVGSAAEDRLGSELPEVLFNGNYVVRSPIWNNGAIADVGAVTWCNGSSGCKGTISAANSLVGNCIGDLEGSYLTKMNNGDYVLRSPVWDDGAIADVGAVTWCNGSSGCKGTISAANSLVGSAPGDAASGGIAKLTNGNYVVNAPDWNYGVINNAGAVTWCSGGRSCTGKVSSANSLVGAKSGDIGRIMPLANGNYLVYNMFWNNDTITETGIVTWCDGTSGCTGAVSAANSLIGSTTADWVGYGIATFPTGDYFVLSPYWDNNGIQDAGAATWCDGMRGCTGVISAANSLVGSTAGDRVSYRGVTFLTNGNYVIRSPYWNSLAGAVTWCRKNDSSCMGSVSAANSLVGSSSGDAVGEIEPLSGVVGLANGNYIVESPDLGDFMGATTWCNGLSGCQGVVSATNSLIGITVLPNASNEKRTAVTESVDGNYNYVIIGQIKIEPANFASAAAFGNGWFGTSGLITPEHQLVGSFAYDRVNNQFVIGQAGDSIVTLVRSNFRPQKAYLPLMYK